MKKLICFMICLAVMTASFSVASYADDAITLDEANALIKEVKSLSSILYSGGIDDYISSEKASKDICDGMSKEYGVSLPSGHIFCAKEGIDSVEYWENKIKGFFTEEYISKASILRKVGGIMAYNGKVYFFEGMVSNISFPNYGMTSPELTVSLSDGDTAVMTAYYKHYDYTETYTFEFENTPDGWRISGGSAADGYMGVKADNPQTSDAMVLICICVLVYVIGFAVTAKKRRYTNIA